MLEPPHIEDQQIIGCLQVAYGISITDLAFLPLGADVNTAVYRAIADDSALYFVKLRRNFDPSSVELPKYLSDSGVSQIIRPYKSGSGQLWANLDGFSLILYPFIEGQNGYRVALSHPQWYDFGAALRRIHAATVPVMLGLQRESYSAQWREQVKSFLQLVEDKDFDDLVAAKLAAFLKEHTIEILFLVERAEHLALALQAQTPEWVVCHSDIHAGNVLMGTNGNFYIVDWDNPILAPKERDLMFIGGSQGFVGYSAEEEVRLFYQGYGPTQINQAALAYYRYERIVQDIAAYCQELLLSSAGGADREQSLGYLMSNFSPGGTIEAAYRSDKS